MICQNCNKNIVKPLELYNGDWACPLCKTTLSIKSIAVRVDKENDETFKLSELCYLRALKNAKDVKRYNAEMRKALEYCRTAARMGNPKALIRLGYFYEYGYISADAFESFKIACEYFKLVWNSEPEMAENPGDPDYSVSCIKLRTAAARRYLELVKKRFGVNRTTGGPSYGEEKAKITAKGIKVPDDPDDVELLGEDRVAHVMGILQSCYSRDRAPLFGVAYLDKGEFGLLCEAKEPGDKQSPRLVGLAQKLAIVLFSADTGDMQAIKKAEDCKRISPDKAYYLYFFNSGGKHKISERKCHAVMRALRSGTFDEYGNVKRIIEVMGRTMEQSDYIFSADDVLMYKSRFESIRHATEDLINAVCSRDVNKR